MRNQARDVVGQRLIAQRAVDVSGASVALQIHGDHLTRRRQQRQHRPEGGPGAVTTVQQNKRLTLTVNLVIQIEVADRRITGRNGRRTGWN